MNNRTREAINKVINVWVDAGSSPEFHDRAKQALKGEWPTLTMALSLLAHETGYKIDPISLQEIDTDDKTNNRTTTQTDGRSTHDPSTG